MYGAGGREWGLEVDGELVGGAEEMEKEGETRFS